MGIEVYLQFTTHSMNGLGFHVGNTGSAVLFVF